MKIIGIVPPSRLRETENPYEDNAIFHELYTKRVEEAGGVPVRFVMLSYFAEENGFFPIIFR